MSACRAIIEEWEERGYKNSKRKKKRMREPDLISLSAVSALALQTGHKTAALLKRTGT